MSDPVDIIVYHNPECGTSRNTLGLIRNAGIQPHVGEYLKTPPTRALLVQLIARAGITPRDLLREKGTPYAELGLPARRILSPCRPKPSIRTRRSVPAAP